MAKPKRERKNNGVKEERSLDEIMKALLKVPPKKQPSVKKPTSA